MSKTESYKEKIKRDKAKRDARKELMSGQEEEASTLEDASGKDVNVNANNNANTNIKEGWSGSGSDRTKMVGLYFEPEVAAALNKLNKSEGRGYKSYLVNKLVKDYLIEEEIKF